MHRFCSLLLALVIALFVISCSSNSSNVEVDPQVSINYEPIIIPITLSLILHSDGYVALDVAFDQELKTPIGVFSVGTNVEAQQGAEQARSNAATLTVRVDGVDYIYELSSNAEPDVSLEPGCYQEIRFYREGDDWYFIAVKDLNNLSCSATTIADDELPTSEVPPTVNKAPPATEVIPTVIATSTPDLAGLTLYIPDANSEFHVIPNLAADMPIISGDELVYTIEIRSAGELPSGREFSARDVAYTFQRKILQGSCRSTSTGLLESLFGADIHDVSQLVFSDSAQWCNPIALQNADAVTLDKVCNLIIQRVHAEQNVVIFTLISPSPDFLNVLATPDNSILHRAPAVESGAWDGDCARWQNYYLTN